MPRRRAAPAKRHLYSCSPTWAIRPRRRQLADVSAASVRILTEIRSSSRPPSFTCNRGVGRAAERRRRWRTFCGGIRCRAILVPGHPGLSGNFLRFQSAEDSIRDPRVHDLTHAMDGLFNLHARVMSEGAAAGTFKQSADLAKQMRRLAQWWDRFATTTVSDVPHVSGKEATASAELVARALGKWRERGAADLSFWREQLDKFHSPKSFALVVDALPQESCRLRGLLMTWLGQRANRGSKKGTIRSINLRTLDLGICTPVGIGRRRGVSGAAPATLHQAARHQVLRLRRGERGGVLERAAPWTSWARGRHRYADAAAGRRGRRGIAVRRRLRA